MRLCGFATPALAYLTWRMISSRMAWHPETKHRLLQCLGSCDVPHVERTRKGTKQDCVCTHLMPLVPKDDNIWAPWATYTDA